MGAGPASRLAETPASVSSRVSRRCSSPAPISGASTMCRAPKRRWLAKEVRRTPPRMTGRVARSRMLHKSPRTLAMHLRARERVGRGRPVPIRVRRAGASVRRRVPFKAARFNRTAAPGGSRARRAEKTRVARCRAGQPRARATHRFVAKRATSARTARLWPHARPTRIRASTSHRPRRARLRRAAPAWPRPRRARIPARIAARRARLRA
jgi:hypothetical protein